MTSGVHIMLLRKQKELSLAALGKAIGTSDENKSFIFRMIDMALRDVKAGHTYATK